MQLSIINYMYDRIHNHNVFLLEGGEFCEAGVEVGWLEVDVSCSEVDWEDVLVLVELVSGGVRRLRREEMRGLGGERVK